MTRHTQVKLPRIDAQWLETDDEISSDKDAVHMPRAEFITADECLLQIEEAASALSGKEKIAPPPKAQDEDLAGADACPLPPAPGYPASARRVGRPEYYAPGAALVVSWLFNGMVAASLFAYMAYRDVTACSALPEPLHTNICEPTIR